MPESGASKNISEYFPAEFRQLRADTELTFHLYLYFEQNQHLILWKRPGEQVTSELLQKYASRGLNRIWIHQDEKDAFLDYLAGDTQGPEVIDTPEESAPPEDPEIPDEQILAQLPTTDEIQAPPPEPREPPRTEEGAFLSEVMNSEQLPDAMKEAIVAEAAREILSDAAEAEDARAQAENNEKLREIVQDVLESTGQEANALVSEIWKMADIDPDLEHAVNVATYSVVFSMAFGKIDPELVADLAMAGLLHDLGICMVDGNVSSKPWNAHGPSERKAYSTHVDQGVSMLKSFVSEAPERVAAVIAQTHEKFDGGGYPLGRKGFNLDDVAQLVALAEFVDSIASGQWDGTHRTMREALKVIEGFEKKKSFPEYFNPEVFGEVVRWTKSTPDAESMRQAAIAVGDRAKDVLKTD